MKKILALSFSLLFLCCCRADAGLLGLWRFEGDASDSSLNSNAGTFENGAALSADTPSGAGQSLALEGGDQHVLVPHHDSLNVTSAVTIAGWVKTTNNAWDGILAKSPSDGSAANHAGNYELRIENGSRGVHLLYQNGGENDTAFHLNNDSPIPDNEWTHIAVTASAEGMAKTYINGVFVSDHADPVMATFGATNTNPLYLGSRADLFTTMDGLLDDLAIFDEVLSESQIQTIAGGDFSAFVVPEPSSGILVLGLLPILLNGRRRNR